MRQCRRTDRPANLARGHANISTTQIYAHLDFQHLARVHDTAHPRARRKNAKIKKDADKSGLTRIEQKEIRDRASSGGGTNFALSAFIRVNPRNLRQNPALPREVAGVQPLPYHLQLTDEDSR